MAKGNVSRVCCRGEFSVWNGFFRGERRVLRVSGTINGRKNGSCLSAAGLVSNLRERESSIFAPGMRSSFLPVAGIGLCRFPEMLSGWRSTFAARPRPDSAPLRVPERASGFQRNFQNMAAVIANPVAVISIRTRF